MNDMALKNITTAFMGLYTGRNITVLLGKAGIYSVLLSNIL